MYDPLKHYIMEGLVIIHSFPSSNEYGRTKVRVVKTKDVVMETCQPMGPLGAYDLRLKHGNVWFAYRMDEFFYEDYTTQVKSKDDALKIENEWRITLDQARVINNLSELA